MKPLKTLEKYLRWLLSDAYRIEADGLAAYRVFYGLFLLFYGVPGFVWVGRNPDVFFRPPLVSLPRFFADGFPSMAVLLLLSAGVCLCLLLVLVGRFTRVASMLFSVFAVVGLSFAFSFGKIDHNLIVWVVPFVMAWSGWGQRFSLDARRSCGASLRSVRGEPVALVGLLVAFCMFTAGVQKVLGGWLDPGTHAAYGYVYQAVHAFDRDPLLASFLLGVDSSALWEAFDYLVITFEVGFLLSFFHPVLFRVFLAGAFFFHLGVFLAMGIRTEMLVVVYVLVLVDWNALVDWVRRRVSSRLPAGGGRVPTWGVWLAVASVGVLYLWGQFRLPLVEARYLSLLRMIQGVV